jgi:hypothetical protein
MGIGQALVGRRPVTSGPGRLLHRRQTRLGEVSSVFHPRRDEATAHVAVRARACRCSLRSLSAATWHRHPPVRGGNDRPSACVEIVTAEVAHQLSRHHGWGTAGLGRQAGMLARRHAGLPPGQRHHAGVAELSDNVLYQAPAGSAGTRHADERVDIRIGLWQSRRNNPDRPKDGIA